MALARAPQPRPSSRSIVRDDDLSDRATIDVWTRTHPKYRIRAIVLLSVNVLLFAGVGSFAWWLRSGDWFAPATSGYLDELGYTFLGVGDADVSLGSLLIDPINVQQVPMQIPILGLLMAALISIPILVAILYRFWSSLPFIAVVGFLAVMPWLAITLLLSCVLASVRPFRTRIRFVSALVGLVPAVVYFALAWSGSSEMIVGRIDPVERIKFVAPWVMAIVAASIAFALVLTIARVVNYRPGAITPLLAVMFGLPVALFEANVGRDELYYRLLESRDQLYFTDTDASIALEQAARERWENHPSPKPPWSAVLDFESTKWAFALTGGVREYESKLTELQTDVTTRCDWFLEHFPDSRYAVNVLFIRARALDMRIDQGEFRKTRWIRFYDDFPSTASRRWWRFVLANAADTPAGDVAALRLAQLDARDGDMDRAVAKLQTLLLEDHSIAKAKPQTGGALTQALARRDVQSSLRISTDRTLIKSQWLYHLIVDNRDPIYGYDPLGGPRVRGPEPHFGMLDLDPRDDQYADNLLRLEQHYPNCQLEDNIDLELADLAPDADTKIRRLNELITRFPGRDAIPEALLRLGLAYCEHGRPDRGDETLRELIQRFPDSIWAQQAARAAPPRTWTALSGVNSG